MELWPSLLEPFCLAFQSQLQKGCRARMRRCAGLCRWWYESGKRYAGGTPAHGRTACPKGDANPWCLKLGVSHSLKKPKVAGGTQPLEPRLCVFKSCRCRPHRSTSEPGNPADHQTTSCARDLVTADPAGVCARDRAAASCQLWPAVDSGRPKGLRTSAASLAPSLASGGWHPGPCLRSPWAAPRAQLLASGLHCTLAAWLSPHRSMRAAPLPCDALEERHGRARPPHALVLDDGDGSLVSCVLRLLLAGGRLHARDALVLVRGVPQHHLRLAFYGHVHSLLDTCAHTHKDTHTQTQTHTDKRAHTPYTISTVLCLQKRRCSCQYQPLHFPCQCPVE